MSSVHPCCPLSIQQSAGRRPGGGLVEAVCKEVQHQAFCQTRHRATGQSNTQEQRKQKQAGETKGGFTREKGICDVCTYKYTTTSFPKRTTPPLFRLLRPPKRTCEVARGPENVRSPSHVNQLCSSNIRMMHNGSRPRLMCAHARKCLRIQRGREHRDEGAQARASTDTCLIVLGCFHTSSRNAVDNKFLRSHIELMNKHTCPSSFTLKSINWGSSE